MNEIKINITNYSVNDLPTYITKGSSGFDIRSNDHVILNPGFNCLVDTGLFMEIPLGFELQIRPRSGLSNKNLILIPNSPGTIDSDYRGEIKIGLWNAGKLPFEINVGDRIAQGVLCPVYKCIFNVVNNLNITERNDKGFGSSGVK